MRRRFRGVTCAYCGTAQAADSEHVFSRKFFTEPQRANLPVAPACKPCNQKKSRLEHYLTAVIPFGGRHADAVESMGMVPRRLAKNAKLHRQLISGRSDVWLRSEKGLRLKSTLLPFEGQKLASFFEFAVRGLYWHHWSTYLSQEAFTMPAHIAHNGEQLIEDLFALNSRNYIAANLGNGTIEYRGAQGVDNTDISVWQFRIYGGLLLAEDGGRRRQTSSISVLTGPKRGRLQEFEALPSKSDLQVETIVEAMRKNQGVPRPPSGANT